MTRPTLTHSNQRQSSTPSLNDITSRDSQQLRLPHFRADHDANNRSDVMSQTNKIKLDDRTIIVTSLVTDNSTRWRLKAQQELRQMIHKERKGKEEDAGTVLGAGSEENRRRQMKYHSLVSATPRVWHTTAASHLEHGHDHACEFQEGTCTLRSRSAFLTLGLSAIPFDAPDPAPLE